MNGNFNWPDIQFESVSVVVPVINETETFLHTIDTVLETNENSVKEVIVVVCDKTTRETLSACNKIKLKHESKVKIIQQCLPFLGGALREGFFAARGSHVIAMYGDGESDPRYVSHLIREARKNPAAVISASRWLKESFFEDYPVVKKFFNYIFQKIFSFVYWQRVTDFTFGYRIYPLQIIHAIKWKEIGHSFVFESIVKPLRLSVDIREIPTVWKRRSEGQSQVKPLNYLRYLWVGLAARITPRRFLISVTPGIKREAKKAHSESTCKS
jgi:glycosyltransferase involved in cell wall biosynthesis